MEFLIGLIAFLLGSFAGYLTAYAKTKGKNKALQEDMASLEDEKQRVQIKYTGEIEELKKRHTLDVELRKYKYQEKKQQFSKYFNLLDQFHGKSNELFTSQFPPILKEFVQSYLGSDEQAKNAAIAIFNDNILRLLSELNQERLKLSTETNSIHLISSPEIDHLLDQLESKIDQATNEAQEMIRVMSTPKFWADQSILAPHQRRVEASGEAIKSFKNELRRRMKSELDEI